MGIGGGVRGVRGLAAGGDRHSWRPEGVNEKAEAIRLATSHRKGLAQGPDLSIEAFKWSGGYGEWAYRFQVRNKRDYPLQCAAEVDVLDGGQSVGSNWIRFRSPPYLLARQRGDTVFSHYEGARGTKGGHATWRVDVRSARPPWTLSLYLKTLSVTKNARTDLIPCVSCGSCSVIRTTSKVINDPPAGTTNRNNSDIVPTRGRTAQQPICTGPAVYLDKIGRGEWIRTTDPSVPNRVLYQAEPRPDRRDVRR